MTPIILIQWLGESQSNWTLGQCQNSMVLNFAGILMSVTIVYAIFTGSVHWWMSHKNVPHLLLKMGLPNLAVSSFPLCSC